MLCEVADPTVPQTQRDQTIALLRKQWAALSLTQGLPDVAQGFNDIRSLDAALTTLDPAFKPDSDTRIDGWLGVIFTPFDPKDDAGNPAGSSTAMADRWNFYLHITLPELGLRSPDRVAPKLIREMNNPQWPNEFRLGLAGALQKMYQQAAQPNPAWEAEVQRFYPAMLASADPWTLRLLPSFITNGLAEPRFATRRKFIPQPETWIAIEHAITRMQDLRKVNAKNTTAASAIIDLQTALNSKPR